MNETPKDIVEDTYDHIVGWYLDWHWPTMCWAAARASPITRMLLDRGAQVVANDISTKQLDMAKSLCPGAVSFFTMFHLPRAEQKTMLAKIHSWLRPGAMFAFNLATVDEEEIHGEFLGHGMFWSSYAVEESRAMVSAAGFEAVETEELEAGDGKLEEGDADCGEKGLW